MDVWLRNNWPSSNSWPSRSRRMVKQRRTSALSVENEYVKKRILPVLFVISLGAVLFVAMNVSAKTATKWALWSSMYKSKVLAQPAPTNGYLRHIEWDGWGFAGAGNTVMYLVFDPADSLLAAANSKAPGKYSGIPCEVPEVSRIERQWYTVLFYTDEDWEHCDPN